MDLKQFIEDVPDFPKPGVTFKSISPLLADKSAFRTAVHDIQRKWRTHANCIVALDARGFIFGGGLAFMSGWPLFLARKKGKLPPPTHEIKYDLEYGSAELAMEQWEFTSDDRILIVDDVLATGGTAAAAAHLVEKAGGTVAGFAFVIELGPHNGRTKLKGKPVQSLLIYE